ncbi:hypothetical protein CR513_13717, partial [Mucuna pruriens]
MVTTSPPLETTSSPWCHHWKLPCHLDATIRNHLVTISPSVGSSDEYNNGVKLFLDFAKINASYSIRRFYCPCVNRVNERRLEIEEIQEHIICDGFCKSYTT